MLHRKDGGGLVGSINLCPSLNISESLDQDWQYVAKSQIVSINSTDNAILIDSELYNGGNGYGQYLVIVQKSKAKVITNAEIHDMSFLGNISRVEDHTVYLEGYRWEPNDAHCCPSREATLEYNIRTGQHRFTLGKRLQ
jgi:hypothetical protein